GAPRGREPAASRLPRRSHPAAAAAARADDRDRADPARVTALWSAVFGADGPVEIEIGPGRGDVLVAFARARPDTCFFAIEHARGAAERLAARLLADGIVNARVVTGDARCIVHELVPPASVIAYHIYFPDPWPKRRHGKR